MASVLPRLRFVCGSVYAWRSPFVLSGSDNVGVATYSKSASVRSAGVPRAAVELAAFAFKFRKSAAPEYATGSDVVLSVSTAAAGRRAPWEHTPQNFSPFCRLFCTSASPSAVTSRSTCLFRCFPSSAFLYRPSSSPSALLRSSGSSAGRKSDLLRTEQAGSVQQHQQRGYQEEQKESQLQHEYRQQLQAHRHQLQHFEHRNGRQRQNRQKRRQQHEREHQQGRSSRATAVLAVSPLLFTQWDETSASKNELIFLAGNALGYCTEKLLENEYGQSVFAFVLGLVYLALLGYEGKVNGAVWRMKHVFGSNMRIVGHPRYAYALPRNPLLSSSQKVPSQRNIC